MGVTIYCKKTGRSIDMGYGGFDRLRNKVAELAGEPFASHYAKLSTPEYMFCLNKQRRESLYAEFDAETQRMVDEGIVPIKIVDFCLQPDCEGKSIMALARKSLKRLAITTTNLSSTDTPRAPIVPLSTTSRAFCRTVWITSA